MSFSSITILAAFFKIGLAQNATFLAAHSNIEISLAPSPTAIVFSGEIFKRCWMRLSISPLENPNKIMEARKDIARIMTELRKRELDSKSVDNK